MTTRLTTTILLGLCGLMFTTGCFNPPVERYYAREALEAGDYRTAQTRAQGVLERDASDWEAHYLLGKALLGMNQPVKAETELQLALAVEDEDAENTPKILDAVAESLYRQERQAELIGFLDAQINRYEGWQDYARKGRFLAKAGDKDNAALAYRQAAYWSKNTDPAIYIEIADFYEGIGNYDRAKQALRWAYYIDDTNEEVEDRFRRLGEVPGPTLEESPPQPEYPGASIFNLPNLIGE